jgi:hypothetical protein
MSDNRSKPGVDVPAVIVAGGLGTRLLDEAMVRPKLTVELGRHYRPARAASPDDALTGTGLPVGCGRRTRGAPDRCAAHG